MQTGHYSGPIPFRFSVIGDRTGAAQHLEAALEIEPWSERTARELNNLRRSVTDNRKGLLELRNIAAARITPAAVAAAKRHVAAWRPRQA